MYSITDNGITGDLMMSWVDKRITGLNIYRERPTKKPILHFEIMSLQWSFCHLWQVLLNFLYLIWANRLMF